MNSQNPLELETPERAMDPAKPDRRPHMPEPLPVRLVAIEDVHLPAPAGVEIELDAFYVALLKFQRVEGSGEALAYRAENFDLHFDIAEAPIAHETLRPLGVEVLSLAELEQKLIELEREYTRLRGTTPGRETLLIRDPAGNWVEIGEVRPIA